MLLKIAHSALSNNQSNNMSQTILNINYLFDYKIMHIKAVTVHARNFSYIESIPIK
jgi:hypothetical protein